MPLALKSLGSHEEIRSVMAAFKKRFFAVLPENSNSRGLPKAEAFAGSDSYLVGAIVKVVMKNCSKGLD